MNLGTARIIHGDARNLPLADGTVDLIVTSPPYFALRSYQDGGEHYDNQLGSEATPAEFVDALIECTREMVRVLKPSGSIFVNLGDKYSGAQAQNIGGANRAGDSARTWAQTNPRSTGIPNKSLMGIPWRYALRCIDDLGLILRAEIIWSKPNGLPESVTDRVRRSHEQWFHMTVQPRYFSAVDEIRDNYAPSSLASYARGGLDTSVGDATHPSKSQGGRQRRDGAEDAWRGNPLGKLPGSVRTVPTSPLTVPAHLGIDHFAAFPPAWPEWIIRGWSPSGVCSACGDGRRPVKGVDWAKVPHRMVEKRVLPGRLSPELRTWGAALRTWRTSEGITRAEVAAVIRPDFANDESATAQLSNWENAYNWPDVETWAKVEGAFGPPVELSEPVRSVQLVPVSLLDVGDDVATTGRHRTTGGGLSSGQYLTLTGESCACPTPGAPTTPATILDPFGGTGTTALVAKALGRNGISVDLSGDYSRLAEWRVNDPGELARVLGVEKPAPQVEGQWDLFGGEVA